MSKTPTKDDDAVRKVGDATMRLIQLHLDFVILAIVGVIFLAVYMALLTYGS